MIPNKNPGDRFIREPIESLREEADSEPVAMLGTEDSSNPHLITAGKDAVGAFIYPFLGCDELCADQPAGEFMLRANRPPAEPEKCHSVCHSGNSEWDSGDVYHEHVACRLSKGHEGKHEPVSGPYSKHKGKMREILEEGLANIDQHKLKVLGALYGDVEFWKLRKVVDAALALQEPSK